MNQRSDLPLRDAIHALMAVVIPGSAVSTVRLIEGDYYNSAHVVKTQCADGGRMRTVVKCYAECGSSRKEKARVEFRTLMWLRDHSVPVPVPLHLDEDGAFLGAPAIVMSHVSGKQIESPSDPQSWAHMLATALAQIHSVPCDATARGFLLDGNSIVTWFLRSGAVPDYMSGHPDGAMVWQTVHDLLPTIERGQSRLVHVDYCPGNVLWDQGEIVAIIDWEEAAYGDPGIDVAYCRMNMFLNGMDQAADEFLSAYEAEMGWQVANLGFWELAAAAKPMMDPSGWKITGSSANGRFRQFIASGRKRVGY